VNWREEQPFAFSLARLTFQGKLPVNGWLVAKQMALGEACVWFFARPPAKLSLEFNKPVFWTRGAEAPSSAASPGAATLLVNLDGGNAPIEIVVRAAGK
jgi:hypothetical protein